VMVYSIALLDQTDFEAIGRQMPKGTGVDNSVAGAASAAPTKKRGKYRKKQKTSNDSSDNNLLFKALEEGTRSETKLSALKLILQYGSTSQKANAMKEVNRIADLDNKKKNATVSASREEQEEVDNAAVELDSNDSSSDGEDDKDDSSTDNSILNPVL
jgi:hypothetical protein